MSMMSDRHDGWAIKINGIVHVINASDYWLRVIRFAVVSTARRHFTSVRAIPIPYFQLDLQDAPTYTAT